MEKRGILGDDVEYISLEWLQMRIKLVFLVAVEVEKLQYY